MHSVVLIRIEAQFLMFFVSRSCLDISRLLRSGKFVVNLENGVHFFGTPSMAPIVTSREDYSDDLRRLSTRQLIRSETKKCEDVQPVRCSGI